MITTERRRQMAKATKGWRLTRRGKWAVAILILIILGLINDSTTPDECKVPTEQMSQFCVDLLYP